LIKIVQNKKNKKYNHSNNKNPNNLGRVFNKHVKCEFEEKDVDETMKTMVPEPYVHHVPVLTGGIGYDGVYNFYKNIFIGKMPSDTKFITISRTRDNNQVVDELIMRFTHDIEIPAMIPGVPPTGKYVELPVVVVMKFQGNKIAHEHIYWDQASMLSQIGLLDSKMLPVTGVEQAKKLQEFSLLTKKKIHKKSL
jgi:carboxymethylenebutenolidase